MFTGIVQGIREISEVTDIEGGKRLRVQLYDLADNLRQGASVAVNGVCLTAVSLEKGCVEFDIIQESLNRSNLSRLKNGDFVDIERACNFGDEVGGHHVTGHIDCMGTIKEVRNTPNNHDIEVQCGKEWMAFLIHKGWITIDGISLTVVDIGDDWFSTSLIPETLEQTILGHKIAGENVNLEFDHTIKVIVQTINRMQPEIEEKILSGMKE